jgi:hypothetical protein
MALLAVLGQLSSASAQTTNTNTITNGGTINSGTTALITNPVTSITGAITNNGSLQFWQSLLLTDPFTIFGTGTLVQAGTGMTILSGSNSYGATVISGGTLAIAATNSLGTGSISFANAGGTLLLQTNLSLSNAFSIATNAAISVQGGNTVTLNGIISGGVGTTLYVTNTGTLNLYAVNTFSALVLSNTTVGIRTNGSMGAGSIVLYGTNTINYSQPTTQPAASYFTPNITINNGIISGSGMLVINDPNCDVTIGSVNTYTGGTKVIGGTVTITADNNLGASTSTLTLDGAEIRINAAAITVARPIVLTANGGALDSFGNSTWASPISGVGGLSIAFDNVTVTLSGSNSYQGTTTIGTTNWDWVA